MTVDNYEQVKQRIHGGALEHDFKGEPTKDVEAAWKQAQREEKAKTLAAQRRNDPDAVKLAAEMLSQPEKTQRERELEAEVARLRGEPTNDLWAS
jgi:hypothetical protein